MEKTYFCVIGLLKIIMRNMYMPLKLRVPTSGPSTYELDSLPKDLV